MLMQTRRIFSSFKQGRLAFTKRTFLKDLFSAPKKVEVPSEGRYIFAFGKGDVGQLGLNKQISGTTDPTPIVKKWASQISMISAGGNFGLALLEDGKVYSWGENSYGQLGLGDTSHAMAPLRIKALEGKKVVYIAAGESHSAAVTEDGELYTWGYYGDIARGIAGLGHGKISHHVTKPTLVEHLKGEKVVQVACGGAHSGCITASGKIFMFGRGDWGRLGLGNTLNQELPKELEMPLFKSDPPRMLSAGDNYSAFVTRSGRLFMYGKNEHLQLGVDSTGNLVSGGQFDGESSPVELQLGKQEDGTGVRKVKEVACGDNLTTAVTEDGLGYVWGKGYVEGPTNPKKLPHKVVSCSSGKNHVAFVTSDGVLFTSGAAKNGQLGIVPGFMNSTQEIHNLASVIPGKVAQSACGINFTLALVDVQAKKQ